MVEQATFELNDDDLLWLDAETTSPSEAPPMFASSTIIGLSSFEAPLIGSQPFGVLFEPESDGSTAQELLNAVIYGKRTEVEIVQLILLLFLCSINYYCIFLAVSEKTLVSELAQRTLNQQWAERSFSLNTNVNIIYKH
jgi:hypothetical protein